MRIVLAFLFAGCIAQARTMIDPPASGGGTLTCRQIAEQCDVNCTDPMCVRACGNQGTPDAAALHNAVVDCAQRNSCMSQDCIVQHCGTEMNACKGPDDPAGPPTTEPAPPLPPVVTD